MTFQREKNIRVDTAARRQLMLCNEPTDETGEIQKLLRSRSPECALLSAGCCSCCRGWLSFFHFFLVLCLLELQLFIRVHSLWSESCCIFIFYDAVYG